MIWAPSQCLRSFDIQCRHKYVKNTTLFLKYRYFSHGITTLLPTFLQLVLVKLQVCFRISEPLQLQIYFRMLWLFLVNIRLKNIPTFSSIKSLKTFLLTAVTQSHSIHFLPATRPPPVSLNTHNGGKPKYWYCAIEVIVVAVLNSPFILSFKEKQTNIIGMQRNMSILQLQS